MFFWGTLSATELFVFTLCAFICAILLLIMAAFCNLCCICCWRSFCLMFWQNGTGHFAS